MTLRPHSYAIATPERLGAEVYYTLCRRAHVDPVPDGYGLLLCEDEQGARWTLITRDIEYVRALSTTDPDVVNGLQIPKGKFPLLRQGVPNEWPDPDTRA
jgi:hypothetical protein